MFIVLDSNEQAYGICLFQDELESECVDLQGVSYFEFLHRTNDGVLHNLISPIFS